ncbi:MAG: N-acetylmuramoyl-L-alanine amidase family protein [Myxococcaceae bacterium]
MTGLLALAALLSAAPAGAEAPERAPRIVLDPGHGGAQEGALGPDGLFEKTLALDLAKALKAELERGGAEVLLTREQDVLLPLSDRVVFANHARPDLFLSLHANSMPTRKLRARVEGIQTFFLSASASGEDALRTASQENAGAGTSGATPAQRDTLAFILADLQRGEAHVDSARLAYALHRRLVTSTGAMDLGVQQAPFYVLMGVEAPAVLVEVGFISHPSEGRRLADPTYRARLVSALTEGIRAFLAEVEVRDRAPAAPSASR